MQHRAAFFYADDGPVASTDPVWLQGAFDTLTGLFNRVRLQTNVGNTVGVICRPFCTAETQPKAAYKRRIMG